VQTGRNHFLKEKTKHSPTARHVAIRDKGEDKETREIYILLHVGHDNENVIQWDLSIKDTLNEGHLLNEDTACSLDHLRAV